MWSKFSSIHISKDVKHFLWACIVGAAVVDDTTTFAVVSDESMEPIVETHKCTR